MKRLRTTVYMTELLKQRIDEHLYKLNNGFRKGALTQFICEAIAEKLEREAGK